MKTATGFDFEPLKGGNVLIEFFGDDGVTFNKQVVNAEVIRTMPLVAVLLHVVMTTTPEVANEIMAKMSQKQRQRR